MRAVRGSGQGASKGDIALFEADDKIDSDGRPDLRGPVTPAGGAKHYASILKKPGRNGTFLAGQVQEQADIDALNTGGGADGPDVD